MQRAKHVSAEKIQQARELVLSKMETARLPEDVGEMERLRKQRNELLFRSPPM